MAQAQLKALEDTPKALPMPGPSSPARPSKLSIKAVESPRLLIVQLQRTRFLYSLAGIILSALFFACLYYFRRDELSDQGIAVLFLSSWLSLLMFINAAKISGELKLLTLIQVLDDTKIEVIGPGPRAG